MRYEPFPEEIQIFQRQDTITDKEILGARENAKEAIRNYGIRSPQFMKASRIVKAMRQRRAILEG